MTLSNTAPAVIATTPNAIRRSKFSRKTNHAIKIENTPSRFNSREALDAAVALRPYIMSTGARMPPALIAAASHQRSAPRRETSTAPENRSSKRSPW